MSGRKTNNRGGGGGCGGRGGGRGGQGGGFESYRYGQDRRDPYPPPMTATASGSSMSGDRAMQFGKYYS